MSLIVEKIGWEEHEETGEPVFRIILQAEREEDVPNMSADVVWGRREVRLSLAADADQEPQP